MEILVFLWLTLLGCAFTWCTASVVYEKQLMKRDEKIRKLLQDLNNIAIYKIDKRINEKM